jgi:hypothetical protein
MPVGGNHWVVLVEVLVALVRVVMAGRASAGNHR